MAVILPGRESSAERAGLRVGRHHHLRAYAALVIAGSYEEMGDRGRFRASVGDALVHRAFDAHANIIGSRGARFINIALDGDIAAAWGRVRDPDRLVRLAADDPPAAARAFAEDFAPSLAACNDWPDMLAHDLAGDDDIDLASWAARHGLHPAPVSRGFARAYGLSPRRYRLEQKASRTARLIAQSDSSLGEAAALGGFADQPHITRTIRAIFGTTPRQLRQAGLSPFKTNPAA